MPWDVGDVEGHKAGLTDAQKKRWVEVANSALAACLKEGRSDCEASAIRQANAVVEEAQHENQALADRILEAVYSERATFKATIQGFLRAARAVTGHKGIPASVKKEIDSLRALLASKKWAELAEEPSPAQNTVEASRGLGEALQSIARKQVRARLREMSLGGISIADFETKLTAALIAKLGTGYEFRVLDIYENAVIFAAEGGMWGAPYTIGLNGAITIGEPIRVKRICRYIPEEQIEQEPEKPIDQEDQGGRLQLPGDWWKYSQAWGNGDRKVLGSTSTDTGPSGANEALREATKTEDGKQFKASDYAYVPDSDAPSTWKLRLTDTPGGAPDSGIVGAAIAALGKGFRGQKVEIPAADLPKVKAKVRAAWKKANPDKGVEEMPPVIREAFTEEGSIVAEFVEDGALVEVGGSDV